MAYVLGFFAADGYITVNKRGGQFWCIDIKDKKLIEAIKDKIESNHKISVRIRHDKKYISYRIQIGSVEMCEDLRRLGFSKNKTKSLSVPQIPNIYFSHFVRGYFDGDGNVWSGLIHKGRQTRSLAIQTVFTSCSLKFLEKLKDRLEKFGILKGRIRGKLNYFRLVYSINSSLKLYSFMYNSLSRSRLFLPRKRSVFEKYIKMRP